MTIPEMQSKLAELQASHAQGINTLNAITGAINMLTALIQEDQAKEPKAVSSKVKLKRIK